MSYRTIQGLLLPRPATCSWHCLYDTGLGLPPVSFQQATLAASKAERKRLFSVGCTQPLLPTAAACGEPAASQASGLAQGGVSCSALLCLSPSWRTTHHNRRRLECQECPCLKQGGLRDPGSFSVLSGNRSDSQVLLQAAHWPPSLSSLFSSLRLWITHPWGSCVSKVDSRAAHSKSGPLTFVGRSRSVAECPMFYVGSGQCP